MAAEVHARLILAFAHNFFRELKLNYVPDSRFKRASGTQSVHILDAILKPISTKDPYDYSFSEGESAQLLILAESAQLFVRT